MSGYGFPLQLFIVAMLLVGCAALLVIRNQGDGAGRKRVGWAIFPVKQRSGAVLAVLVLCLGALMLCISALFLSAIVLSF